MKTKTIKNHEQEYYHIPKGRLRYIILTIVLLLITIGSFYVLVDSWNYLNLDNLECTEDNCNYYPYQLMIIPILIINYILINLTIISFFSIFKKLKSYRNEGLIVGSLVGSLAGLILGLMGKLILGLIVGSLAGLIWGLMVEYEN